MEEDIIREEERIAEERAAEAARLGKVILNKPIREIAMLRPAVCLASTTSVRVAIQRMNESRVGCVLVEESGRLVGIFTERDVLTKVAVTEIDTDATPLSQVMTPDPESLGPDDRVSFALNRMSVGGFRHIPLTDGEGRPVGVVSMRNVVDHVVDLFQTQVLNLPPTPGFARTREGA